MMPTDKESRDVPGADAPTGSASPTSPDHDAVDAEGEVSALAAETQATLTAATVTVEAARTVATPGGCEITDLTPVPRAAMMRALAARAAREGVTEEPGDPPDFADAIDRCLDESSRLGSA